MPNQQINITGVAHIYISVSDIARSQRFYNPIMKLLGFKRSSGPLAGGDYHVHYWNRITQYTLRPARTVDRPHDPYAPGLHHICFWVETTEEIDSAYKGLHELSIKVTVPQWYPEYEPDYYAIFFEDPDGIRLEIRNFGQPRRERAASWDEIPWNKG